MEMYVCMLTRTCVSAIIDTDVAFHPDLCQATHEFILVSLTLIVYTGIILAFLPWLSVTSPLHGGKPDTRHPLSTSAFSRVYTWQLFLDHESLPQLF